MHFRKSFRKTTGYFRPLFCLILSGVLALSGVIPALAAKDSNSFLVSVTYGFENKVEYGCYVPVNITVENNGDNFEGRVQLIIPQPFSEYESKSFMYEKDLSLAAGTSKTVSLTIPASSTLKAMTVRIVNGKEKVLYKKDFSVLGLTGINSINIGVLSDDFSALSYLSGRSLYFSSDNKSIDTRICELSSESFPDDSKALDMMDFILITNYSTDKLSTEQLNALGQWVNNGGTLILGTGSTAGKVLSGLKSIPAFSALSNETAGIDYITIDTDYGLSSADSDMIKASALGGSGYYNSYNLDVYNSLPKFTQNEFENRLLATLTEFENWYNYPIYSYQFDDIIRKFCEDNSDFLIDKLAPQFLGFTPDPTAWQSYAFNEMYDRIMDFYPSIVESMQVEAKANSGSGKSGTDFATVKAEIARFNPSVVTSMTPVIVSKNFNSINSCTLVSKLKCGSGAIAVAGIDFTQNPLTSYSDRNYFATFLFKSLISYNTLSLIINYNNQSGYYGYGYPNTTMSNLLGPSELRTIFDTLDNASAPPVLLYTLILVTYLISIFVTYSKLKKKGKSVLFWIVQAGSALAFSLIILICSFSTRIHSAQLRIAQIKDHTGNQTSVLLADSLLMPQKKQYTVDFNNALNTAYYLSDNRLYFVQSQNAPSSEYYLGMNRKSESTTYKINNKEPLFAETFYSSYIDSADTGHFTLDISSDKTKITVTNNTGADLTKAFVVAFNEFYPLNDIADGETKVLSLLPNNSLGNPGINYRIGSRFGTVYEYFVGNPNLTFRELFIGSKSSSEMKNRVALEMYMYVYSTFFSDNFRGYIGGISKNAPSTNLQNNSNVKETVYELHVQSFSQLSN